MGAETRKPRSRLKGWWWKLPVALVGLMLVADASGILGPAGIPMCDSSNAKGTLKTTFDGSQFARNLGLSAIEIRAAEELGTASDEQRRCTAVIALNNAQEVPVEYTMTHRDGGRYLLEFEVRR